MNGRTIVRIAATAALIALHAEHARAQQAAPPPPPRVAQPSAPAATGAAAAAAATPLPTPPAPTPPKVVVPASVLPPNDSAVALCNNGTFVMKPRTVADCANRGGLKIALAQKGVTAPTRRVAASQSVRPAVVAQAPPAGATMHCKDGTYLTGTPNKDRCANNGGLAAILPSTPPAPAAPARRP